MSTERMTPIPVAFRRWISLPLLLHEGFLKKSACRNFFFIVLGQAIGSNVGGDSPDERSTSSTGSHPGNFCSSLELRILSLADSASPRIQRLVHPNSIASRPAKRRRDRPMKAIWGSATVHFRPIPREGTRDTPDEVDRNEIQLDGFSVVTATMPRARSSPGTPDDRAIVVFIAVFLGRTGGR